MGDLPSLHEGKEVKLEITLTYLNKRSNNKMNIVMEKQVKLNKKLIIYISEKQREFLQKLAEDTESSISFVIRDFINQKITQMEGE